MESKAPWIYGMLGSLLISGTLAGQQMSYAAPATNAGENAVKNIIMVIPDGMGNSITGLTRWYQNGTPLEADKYVDGLVKTTHLIP
ncbi:alkaline phosphatase [Paenibacillus shirakamiensis]|uniref:Alkaline phosphatase n=1 Tax=Paenibacillus shirakamiensis TaxID=1265935 RepID=A0ABS4JEL3_9BACL|nr:hypothetical protein [Paenibacillus shirakamiensis]MBP2000130.1 alkaline phosphatase [Paenibacillus shirakamiensis]